MTVGNRNEENDECRRYWLATFEDGERREDIFSSDQAQNTFLIDTLHFQKPEIGTESKEPKDSWRGQAANRLSLDSLYLSGALLRWRVNRGHKQKRNNSNNGSALEISSHCSSRLFFFWWGGGLCVAFRSSNSRFLVDRLTGLSSAKKIKGLATAEDDEEPETPTTVWTVDDGHRIELRPGTKPAKRQKATAPPTPVPSPVSGIGQWISKKKKNSRKDGDGSGLCFLVLCVSLLSTDDELVTRRRPEGGRL